MKTAGIVLAAGASRRMGTAKALLRGADGLPLAARQAAVLHRGGCGPVAVVLGSERARVRGELPDDLRVVENPRWALGRATSLQAGIRAMPEAEGFLFLPVDAVGVAADTVRRLLAAAADEPAAAWRPVCRGHKGNLLWLSPETGRELLRLPADARVDDWIQPRAREIEVPDPAILNNFNSPEEWTRFVRSAERGGFPG